MPDDVLLETRDLSKRFRSFEAVRHVSFILRRGESVGLVGESGCGKSTLALLLIRLLRPSSGRIFLRGKDVWTMRGESLRIFQSSVQIVFQNPNSSLNPFFSIGESIAEPLIIHHRSSGKDLEKKVDAVLGEVGLEPGWRHRLPETLSGGQCQRVGIARALALEPELLICDEPTSSLDVMAQAQILQLLNQLQSRRGLAILFISHNLAVVSALADRILVMDGGQIVEEGRNPEFFHHPVSPAAQVLVKAAL